MQSRVQKILAQAGLCSRREAETWISAGRVMVNGQRAVIGQVADTESDVIAVDGRILSLRLQRVYLILNKPIGYTTSLKDRHAEHIISELVPSKFGRVFPVGRLDKQSSGLIVLTNDGFLAHRLMHPSYAVAKVYEVLVQGVPRRTHLARMTRGIQLDDGYAKPRDVRVIRSESNQTLLRLTLTEGKKREVRRIFEAIGHPVISLKRVAFGSLTLGSVPEGNIRPLTNREVKELYALVQHPQKQNSTNRRDDRSSEYTQPRLAERGVRYSGRFAISTRHAKHTVGNSRRNSGRDYR